MNEATTPAPNYPIDSSGVVRTDEAPVTPALPPARGRSRDARTAEARAAVMAARPSVAPGAGAGPVTTEAAPAPVLVRPTLAPDLEHRLTQDDMDTFASVSSRLGLTTPQAQSLVDFFAGRVKANADQNRRPTEAAATVELQAEWREHFDRKVASARRAVEALGGDRLRAHLIKRGLNNDPEMVRLFAGLGEKMTADAVQRARVLQGGRIDRETAQLEHDRIMRDKTHDYWQRNSPAHRRAVTEVNPLAATVYGTTPLPEAGVDTPTPAAPTRTREEAVTLATLALQADHIAKSWIGDPTHPINQRHSPQHKDAVKQYNELLAVAHRKTAAPGRDVADKIFNDARQGRKETR